MRGLRRILAGTALPLVAAGAAWLAPAAASARDLTPDERASLARALDAYAAATAAFDGTALAAALPPRTVGLLATKAGIDGPVERRAIADQFEAAKAAGLRMTLSYDLDGASFASLKDGTPYVVVPMHGVEESPVHQDLRVKALALMEGGSWYFLSLNTPLRMERLREAYPEFDGVTFDDAAPAVRP